MELLESLKTEVAVRNLEGREDLDGKTGTIIGYIPESDRLGVKFLKKVTFQKEQVPEEISVSFDNCKLVTKNISEEEKMDVLRKFSEKHLGLLQSFKIEVLAHNLESRKDFNGKTARITGYHSEKD